MALKKCDDLMKLLKTLFCSLLLILASCSQFTEKKKEDKKWRNDLAKQTINGVKNPYMIDEFIYKYGAIDRIALYNDNPSDYCWFSVYSLKKSTNITNLQNYLNQFNSEQLVQKLLNKKNRLSFYILEDERLISKWLHNNEVSQKLFEPLDTLMTEDKRFSQTMYDRHKECIVFFEDKMKFLKIYSHLSMIEDIKYKNFNRSNIVEILNNPNTLVKFDLWRNSGSGNIYFYDANRQYFIVLNFQPSFN